MPYSEGISVDPYFIEIEFAALYGERLSRDSLRIGQVQRI